MTNINEIADRLRELDLIINKEKYEHLREWQQERDDAMKAKVLKRLGLTP